jgi:nicotinamidase-related amidase
MPISTIDDRTALIVIDLQKGIVQLPTVHPMAGVLERCRALIDGFRQHGLPVVLVNVAGGAPGRTEQPPRAASLPAGFTDLIPELDRQPGDIVVTKRTWGAFPSTDLHGRLQALRVTQVVVVGVATGTGVDATARQAYELGYNVTLAVDAMTDTRPAAHDYSVLHIFPRLGETGTAQDILDLLAKRSSNQ